MTRHRHPGFAATLALALALTAQAAAVAARTGDLYERRVDPITKSFARTTIQWTGTLSGTTMIVYGVEEHAGRIAVCGLHMSEGRVSRDAVLNGLRVSSIASGGHILTTDLRYFDEFAGPRDFFRFACRVTKYRWAPAYGRVRPKYIQGKDFVDPSKKTRK